MKFINPTSSFALWLGEHFFWKVSLWNPTHSLSLLYLFIGDSLYCGFHVLIPLVGRASISCYSYSLLLLALLKVLEPPRSLLTKEICIYSFLCLQCFLFCFVFPQVSSCPLSFLTSSSSCPYVTLLARPSLKGILDLSPHLAKFVVFALIYFSP